MEYIKKQILHERKIGDRQLLINNDGTIELNPGNSKVKITGNLEVTGTSSGPTNSLVYYVSLEGNDTNDGLAAGPDRAKKTGALVTVSPYVQNCTNMNGPWLNDGTEFTPFVTEQITGVTPGARPIIDDESVPLAKRVNDTGGGNGMLVDGNDYDQRFYTNWFLRNQRWLPKYF